MTCVQIWGKNLDAAIGQSCSDTALVWMVQSQTPQSALPPFCYIFTFSRAPDEFEVSQEKGSQSFVYKKNINRLGFQSETSQV